MKEGGPHDEGWEVSAPQQQQRRRAEGDVECHQQPLPEGVGRRCERSVGVAAQRDGPQQVAVRSPEGVQAFGDVAPDGARVLPGECEGVRDLAALAGSQILDGEATGAPDRELGGAFRRQSEERGVKERLDGSGRRQLRRTGSAPDRALVA